MYDAISTGTLEDKGQVARRSMFADFDLYSVPLYAEDINSSKSLLLAERPGPEDIYIWAVEMSEKGVL